MSSEELVGHARKKVQHLVDGRFAARRFGRGVELEEGSTFPRLPEGKDAPESLRATLAKDAAGIMAGRWMAFGQLELEVDDPPRWHKDYLAGVDLTTKRSAFKLDHRLKGEADIKLIWEPSRWYSLVRLAQAAYVLGDARASRMCRRWLKNWIDENPPFSGWNWTSALESGLRLVQFVWIDGLLAGAEGGGIARSAGFGHLTPPACPTIQELGGMILAPHVYFTWRGRSFGSSANNHLLGELAGLILALVRWPSLARWAVPVSQLQEMWEGEVLRQFASDGGNREQALNYHLFSWEFCWQTRLALRSAGRTISEGVEERLRAGAEFYDAMRMEGDLWDFGDSDGAYVTPFFEDWRSAPAEWQRWVQEPARSRAIHYWIGDPPRAAGQQPGAVRERGWRVYAESGMAVWKGEDWFLRWDLSPLGYLATASHGHCDALHVSIWHQGQPLIIDPGTGAYYTDKRLRDYLASWDCHNGPRPLPAELPERMGTFLWRNHHQAPRWRNEPAGSMSGELPLPSGLAQRTIQRLEKEDGWQIEDAFTPAEGVVPRPVVVFWQFAPGTVLEPMDKGVFRVRSSGRVLTIRFDSGWEKIEHRNASHLGSKRPDSVDLRGICSGAFRQTEASAYIQLQGRGTGRMRTLLVATRI